MFIIRTGLSNTLHWKGRLGLEANDLSPLPAILEDFAEEAAPDQSAELSSVPEEDLGRALAILLQPERRFTIRCGGNLIVPEQLHVYFAPNHNPSGLAMVYPTPFDTAIVHYFATAGEWTDWVTQKVDPMGLSQPGEQVIPDPMNYQQLLHLLHTADMYRRLYYQSMLDYIPVSDLTFSTFQYAEAMRDSVSSGDYRWLVPSLLYMLPQGMPLGVNGLSEQFESMKNWGLITPVQQEDDYDLYKFTPRGDTWGLEFMTRWISALSMNVSIYDGKVKAMPDRLFLLGTTLSIHAFSFNGLGLNTSIEHAALGADRVAELLQTLLKVERKHVTSPEQEKPESPTPELAQPTEQTPSAPIPTPSTAYCPKCGQKVNPVDNFCINCGIKL